MHNNSRSPQVPASQVGDTVVSILPAFFIQKAHELAKFRETEGRMPVQCDAADPQEHDLGDFLRVQRRQATLGERLEALPATTKARVAYLDKVAPGWRTDNVRPFRRPTPSAKFSDRAQQVAQFVSQRGAFPTITSTDADERTLGRFLVNARQAKKGRGTMVWDQSRQDIMDSLVPGWEDVNTGSRFYQNLENLRAFVNTTRRVPTRSRKTVTNRTAREQYETSLAVFIMNTKIKHPDRYPQVADILRNAA